MQILSLKYVIPACPESAFRKDSRRASLAGMTSYLSLLMNSLVKIKIMDGAYV